VSDIFDSILGLGPARSASSDPFNDLLGLTPAAEDARKRRDEEERKRKEEEQRQLEEARKRWEGVKAASEKQNADVMAAQSDSPNGVLDALGSAIKTGGLALSGMPDRFASGVQAGAHDLASDAGAQAVINNWLPGVPAAKPAIQQIAGAVDSALAPIVGYSDTPDVRDAIRSIQGHPVSAQALGAADMLGTIALTGGAGVALTPEAIATSSLGKLIYGGVQAATTYAPEAGFAAQAYGDKLEQARAEGATDDQARLSAQVSGGLTAVLSPIGRLRAWKEAVGAASVLGDEGVQTLAGALKAAKKDFAWGATDMGLMTIAQRAVDLSTYQRAQGQEFSHRDLLSAAGAAITGGVVNALTGLTLHPRETPTETVTPEGDPVPAAPSQAALEQNLESSWAPVQAQYQARLAAIPQATTDKVTRVGQIVDSLRSSGLGTGGAATITSAEPSWDINKSSEGKPLATLGDAFALQRSRQQAQARGLIQSELPSLSPREVNDVLEGKTDTSSLQKLLQEREEKQVRAAFHTAMAEVAKSSGSTLSADMADATADAATTTTPGPTKQVTSVALQRAVKREYNRRVGLPEPIDRDTPSVDADHAKNMADWYDSMQHDPHNPEVQNAYEAFSSELLSQWKVVTDLAGTQVTFHGGKGEPYKNSEVMRQDLAQNNSLKILPTVGGADLPADHPMMRGTGILLPVTDESGAVTGQMEMRVNDVFRAVHDMWGHGAHGFDFSGSGELGATLSHADTFSLQARRALRVETEAQNSWVNYGPHMRRVDGSIPAKGDPDYVKPQDRPFAPQKAGVVPTEWAMNAEELANHKAEQIAGELDPKVLFQPARVRVVEKPDHSYRGTRLFSEAPDRAHLYVAVNDNGEEVGYHFVHAEDGGFKTKNVGVEESDRGRSIPELLYRAAHRDLGRYLGSTDYLGRRTPAGERMHQRLLQSVPEVFADNANGPTAVEVLQRAGAVPSPDLVAMDHYSSSSGLEVLDPSFHGTGMRGQEARRRINQSAEYKQRLYAYQSGTSPEPGLGPFKYRVTVPRDQIYNLDADPLGLVQKVSSLTRVVGYEGSTPIVRPLAQDEALTTLENAVVGAGYRAIEQRREDTPWAPAHSEYKIFSPVETAHSILAQGPVGERIADEALTSQSLAEAHRARLEDLHKTAPEDLAYFVADMIGRGKVGDGTLAQQLIDEYGSEFTKYVPDAIARGRELRKEARVRGEVAKKTEAKRLVGAPTHIVDSLGQEALTRRIMRYAKLGERGRMWYERSSAKVLEIAHDNVADALKIVKAIAITSPQNPVHENWVDALQAYYQYKAGEPITAGKTGSIDKRLEGLFYRDESWGGLKTNNFYINMTRLVDPLGEGHPDRMGVTVDVHMMRALGYKTDAPTERQYGFASDTVKEAARRLGWEPQQVQAGAWTAQKHIMDHVRASEKTGDPAVRRSAWSKDVSDYDFAHSAVKESGQVSVESTPGSHSALLPWMTNAPEWVKSDYHEAVNGALIGPDGTDTIAKQLGLLIVDHSTLPGVWEGNVNPSEQYVVAMPKQQGRPTKTAVEPSAIAMVETFAAAHGLARHQDSIGYTRPFFDTTVKDSNGVYFTGDKLTPEMARRLDEKLRAEGTDSAIISTEKGFILRNFSDQAPKGFRSRAEAIVASVSPAGSNYQSEPIAINGELINGGPNGQGYEERIAAPGGRPDLLASFRSLRDQVQRVAGDFQRRFDLGRFGPNLLTGKLNDKAKAAWDSVLAAGNGRWTQEVSEASLGILGRFARLRMDKSLSQFIEDHIAGGGRGEGIAGLEGQRGATQILNSGKAIIHALHNADATTLFHELFHVVVRVLPTEDRARLGALIGVDRGQAEKGFSKDQHEALASLWEQWLHSGKAPSGSTKSLFGRIKRWFTEAYTGVREATPVPDSVHAVFSELLTKKGNGGSPIVSSFEPETLFQAQPIAGQSSTPPMLVTNPVAKYFKDRIEMGSGDDLAERLYNGFRRELVDRQNPILAWADKVQKANPNSLLARELPALIRAGRDKMDVARSVVIRGTHMRNAMGQPEYTGKGLKQILAGRDRDTIQDAAFLWASESHLEEDGRRQGQVSKFMAETANYHRMQAELRDAYTTGDPHLIKFLQKTMPERPSKENFLRSAKQDLKSSLTPEEQDQRDAFEQASKDSLQQIDNLKQKWGPRYGDLESLVGEVRGWVNRGALDVLLHLGRISRDKYDTVLKAKEKYAPFVRVIDDMKDDLAPYVKLQSDTFGRRTAGLEEGILNPFLGSIMKVQQVQKWAADQYVYNAFHELKRDYPSDLPDLVPVGINSKTGQPMPDFSYNPMRHIRAWDKGKAYHYEAPHEAMHALRDMNPVAQTAFFKMFRGMTQLKKIGITLALPFAVRNVPRDQQHAAIHSDWGYVPGYHWTQGVIGVMGTVNPRLGALAPELTKFANEYFISGAGMSGFLGHDMTHADISLEKLIQEPTKVSQWMKSARLMFKEHGVIGGVEHAARTMLEIGEMGTRVGGYINARRGPDVVDKAMHGVGLGKIARPLRQASVNEAMIESRSNVGLDFSQMGESGRLFNSLKAFANPDIQDVEKVRESFAKAPLRTAAKVFAYITLPSLIEWATHKDDQTYHKLNVADRWLFYHVNLPDGGYFRIPRPQGLLNIAFGYASQLMLDHAHGIDPEAASNFATAMIESTPTHFLYEPAYGAARFGLGMLPTAFEPLMNVYANRDDYTRRNIENPFDVERHIDRHYLGAGQAGPTARAFAEHMGGGVISAPQFEYLVGQYAGNIGRQALQTSDAVIANMTGQPLTEGAAVSDPNRVLRVLGLKSVRPVGPGSQPVLDFKSYADKADGAANTIKQFQENGQYEQAVRYSAAHPEAGFDSYFTEKSRVLNSLRKDRMRILDDKTISPEQRYKELLEIGAQMTQEAQASLDYYRQRIKELGKSYSAQ
jgi:hypothetical protein